jgi:hypothetical protein
MGHRRALKKRRELRFAGVATGEVKSFKNKSTAISCLQRKSRASFAKLLDGKMKQQAVAVVAENLCLCRFMILLKISNSCLKAHCF